MAITTLTNDAPIRRSTRRPNLDYEHLEAAATLAEEGRPVEALLKVFAHLLPGEKIPDLATQAFSFTQGSSTVTTRIVDDDVVISVPLVKLPEGGRAIAALRYVLTNISATGQLYQPRLRGDDIHLEFRDRLARLHPAKVVEVLRKMPAEADENDDFLVGEFGALPIDRAPIAPLDEADLARAETIWRSHWNVVEELLKECQRKRSMFFLNEMTAYAFHHIDLLLPLSGVLAARLSQAASTFQDSDIDPVKRETVLAKCAKDMKAVSTDDLRKSLGHATYAISPLADGSARASISTRTRLPASRSSRLAASCERLPSARSSPGARRRLGAVPRSCCSSTLTLRASAYSTLSATSASPSHATHSTPSSTGSPSSRASASRRHCAPVSMRATSSASCATSRRRPRASTSHADSSSSDSKYATRCSPRSSPHATPSAAASASSKTASIARSPPRARSNEPSGSTLSPT